MSLKDLLTILVLCVVVGPAAAFELVYGAGSEPVLAAPHDIVLSPDRRHLYVADNNNDRIAVIDPDRLELLTSFGGSQLRAPHDVAFQTTERLLVADTGNNRIAIFLLQGTTARLAGELRGAFSRPEGVAVHPNRRIYVTGAGSGNIEAFEDGHSVARAGGLSSPHDVSIDPEGDVWIADAGNDRLVEMSEDLRVKQVLEGAPYHFNGPRYLAFDSAGRLYVADKYSHQIKVLAPDKRLIYILGSGRAGRGAGEFDRPEGVTLHGKTVWFSDTYNDRIVRYGIQE